MYKWCIDIILKNSGVILPCVYDGPEDNSIDVMQKIFAGKAPNETIGLAGNNGRSQTFVIAGEVASVDIYERICSSVICTIRIW